MYLSKPVLNQDDTTWGSLLGGGAYIENDQRHFLLSVFNLHQPHPSGITTRFLPHGIAMDPQDKLRLVLFEKIGPGACEVDLGGGTVTRPLPASAGHAFYGHGAFSPDGSLLYATETALNGLTGAITVRDGRSLALLGAFPSYGHKPHDCQLIDDGRTMVVANAGAGSLGEAGCLSYVDVQTGALLERVPVPNDRVNAGHFAIAGNGDVALISAPTDGLGPAHNGGVALRHPKSPLMAASAAPHFKHQLKGETLSVAINTAGNLALTCTPDANLVCAWRLDTQQLVKAMPYSTPRGITLSADGNHFLISYGNNAAVIAIHAETLAPVSKAYSEKSFLTGSHLWNWQREVRSTSLR
ncbi:DUF1513 domain-containing protein [Chitinimonas sp.]|uniref:DUF1513 domain-containing protein n=1 Tax=Chitinimonas sp. TaxID=1934313 RepID=UPI002F94C245